jgi:hypothetical protein
MIPSRVRSIAQAAFLAIVIAWIAVGPFYYYPPKTAAEKGPQKEPNTIVEPERAEDRIARYNLWLAILTGALVVTSGIQFLFLYRADKTARISAHAAKKAAEAATLNARANIRTELPILRIDAPRVTQQERPRMEGMRYEDYVPGIPDEDAIIEDIVVVNYGRTPAFPIRLDVGWTITGQLPETPRYAMGFPSPRQTMIRPSETHVFEFRTYYALSETEITGLAAQEAVLWVFVCLHYVDFLNERHEARACWCWERVVDRTREMPAPEDYWMVASRQPPIAYERST